MPNLPPKHQDSTPYHTQQRRYPPSQTQQRPSLPVQQSYLSQKNRQTSTQNLRVPAVNTLKSGGPRLAVPKKMQPDYAEHVRRQRYAAAVAKAKRRSMLRDFLFGFVVGLLAFGIAAIFVCQALINMFIA